MIKPAKNFIIAKLITTTIVNQEGEEHKDQVADTIIEIVRVGKNVKDYKKGDRIIVGQTEAYEHIENGERYSIIKADGIVATI